MSGEEEGQQPLVDHDTGGANEAPVPFNHHFHHASHGDPIDGKDAFLLCGRAVGEFNLSNSIALALAFLMLFAAYNAVQNLATTVAKSLGYISLFIVYTSFSVSTLCAPPVVRYLGLRASMVYAGAAYCLYIAAYIRVFPAFLLLASVVLGMGAALLWTAQGTFISQSCNPEDLGKFSGIFFGILQLSQIIGPLLAQVLLAMHMTFAVVMIVLLSMGLVATFVGLTQIRAPRPPAARAVASAAASGAEPSVVQRLLEVVRLFQVRELQLLAVPSVYYGVSEAFMFGKFPTLVGLERIGLAMACFGIANAVFSVVLGKLSDLVGRKPVLYVGGFGFCLGVLCALTGRPGLLLLAGFLFGFADSAYTTQLSAIFGAVFPRQSEAAFAAFRCVQALSIALGFALSLVTSALVNSIVIIAVLAAALGAITFTNVSAPAGGPKPDAAAAAADNASSEELGDTADVSPAADAATGDAEAVAQ